MTGEAPGWFTAALAKSPELCGVLVDGLTIRYRTWGPPGAPLTVLVHGGAANAAWWDHIAPLLGDDRQVNALDLSGHGDSDRRDSYSVDAWAGELIALLRAGSCPAPAYVVGHSMGGYVALRAAALAPETVAGVVIVDSKIGGRSPEQTAAAERRAFRAHRTYRSAGEAIARFRPVPDIDSLLPYVAAHVAAESVREADGGWQWKFDPRVFLRAPGSPLVSRAVQAPLVLLRAQRGLLTPAMADLVQRDLGRRVPVVELPHATHHAMLDQPLMLIAALRTVFSTWDHEA
jgi:pimeloyl-ACP methyl ester carboxylesterase